MPDRLRFNPELSNIAAGDVWKLYGQEHRWRNNAPHTQLSLSLPPLASPESPTMFGSFWIGGFESACHINSRGKRLDMLALTQHDRFAEADYAALADLGIRGARDAVRWHRIESSPGRYDFRSLRPLARAAKKHGVRVAWNLCHYGWPNDVDVFSPQFIDRFARFAGAVAKFFADLDDAPPIYTPVNEISFMCWAVTELGAMYPYAKGRGDELKRQLVRATLAACDAVWEVDPRARILHAEPLIRVFEPRNRPDLAAQARADTESQFQAMDMIAGRRQPELGGDAKYLDLVGLNYYFNNQWEMPYDYMPWEPPVDERRLPLHRLLAEVHRRYRRPLVICETSHFGSGRARWLRDIALELARARRLGLPVEAACLYPILDRPDWENPRKWHNSGLWDLVPDGRGRFQRVLHGLYAHELRRAQNLIARGEPPPDPCSCPACAGHAEPPAPNGEPDSPPGF